MDLSFLNVLLPMLFQGLKVTLYIAVVGILLGFLLGAVTGFRPADKLQESSKAIAGSLHLGHTGHPADRAGAVCVLCRSETHWRGSDAATRPVS